jgi:hypothetical protein
LLFPLALTAPAQDFSQRGFIEAQFFGYPQTAPNDSGQAIGESLLRYEAFYKHSGWLFAGAVDAQTDTHHQDERTLHLSWWDRETLRPAFAIRRLSASYRHGPLSVEFGKQFIRWGKADILNPTDRFAPRDFLNVVDNDFLAVFAARLTYERGGNTLDLVWQPRFTPARIPLLNQRWVVLPATLPPGVSIVDGGARYPGGSQYGARWNHIGKGFEYSLSFYEGFDYLPLINTYAVAPDALHSGSAVTPPESAGIPPQPPSVLLQRFYPQMRMYGGDAALPLSPFTIKAEAGYFTSSTPQAANYALYVVQLERQTGEWTFTGGYAGEAVTRGQTTPGFAYDRGLARAFLGRAGYTIDTNRSVAFEAAVRQNGEGVWLTGEYSQAMGQHWRATVALTLIRGSATDFLGQYNRNSHATLTLRYSF